MSWLDAITDARSVQAIFKDKVPTLDRLILHEVRLHRDGPKLTLEFDLPEYPSTPPAKWVAQNSNTVRIQLMLEGIESISIRNISTESIIDLNLSLDRGSRGLVHAWTSDESSTIIDAIAQWAIVTKISAYQDASKLP